jgi:hypothetical protein
LWAGFSVSPVEPTLRGGSINAHTRRRFNKWAGWAWLASFIPIALTDLKTSVPLLVFISIYANVVGHWSANEATKAAEKD